jgi:hypothetical protein
MALPTLLKSWQFNVNQQIGSWSTALAANQSAMQTIKLSLKGFSLSPWTVWGSCNGRVSTPSFGNGDGVDYWVSPATDILWAASGNHSWIVLRQAGLGAKSAICIDLLSASSWLATIVFSPSAGFGATNGGTDGTSSARPTATDEVVLLSAGAWGGYNGVYTWRLHVMQSTQGECTRVAMMRNGASVGLWMFDTVKNPVTGWTTPVVGLVVGDSALANAATYANLSSALNTKGRMAGDACTYYMTYEAYGTTGLPSVVTSPDDDSGEWPLYPVGLVQSSSVKHRGRKGELFDFWWGPARPLTGDTYPDDATRVLIQHGNTVHPWDGSVPWNMV